MEDRNSKPDLPGNHGQFGVNNATEAYKPLENHEDAGPSSAPDPIHPVPPGSKDPEEKPGPFQQPGP